MRKITVRDYTHEKYRFVVNWRESGKRKRKVFETRATANAFCAFKNAELKKYGIEGSEFSSRLREMARECAETLSAYGKTIKEATDFFVSHLKASEKSCTAKELVKELVAAKKADGVSKRHLSDCKCRLSIFAEAFDGRMVATITTAEINEWLRSLKVAPITRNHYRRLLINAFNYAVKLDYATDNPAEETDKAKVIGKPPGILTVTQTARLLESATPDIQAYVAIGAFAGLRRAELERLDWKEIDFESGLIEVTAENAKTARRRHVTIQPNLRQWLLPVRKREGNVTPQENFRQAFDQARDAAGIKEDWPENALRHSFASYHLPHFKDAKALALEMGHTNENMIFSNYRELVKPKDAARYWKIEPAVRARRSCKCPNPDPR